MAVDTFVVIITLAIACAVSSRLLHRHVLKDHDPYAYALLTQIIAVLMLLPLALRHASFPREPLPWIVLGIAGLFWSALAIIQHITYKRAEVSIRDPVSQSKILWALLFGVLFLREAASGYRIAGTIIVFLGISLLLWHPEKKFGRLTDPGVRWTLLNALLAGIVAVIDKYALGWFPPEFYVFLVYTIPLFVLLPFFPKRAHHMKALLKLRWFTALLGIVLATSEYFFTVKAYSLADVTLVYPLINTKTLLVVLAGIFVLGEREHFWQKIIATAVVVAGILLVGM